MGDILDDAPDNYIKRRTLDSPKAVKILSLDSQQ